MYSFYSVTTMTTISKGSCDVKIYWLTQTMKRDVYATMQELYFAFYPYFTRSQYSLAMSGTNVINLKVMQFDI